MKKFLAIMCALAMCATAAVSASAATVDQTATDAAQTTFTYVNKIDPTYTVTIPSEVTLSNEGSQVDFSAENVANLDNQKVSVTIAGTNYYRNQMVLTGKKEVAPTSCSMRYQFILADDTVVETTGQKDQVNGVELASFTEDGTKSITAKPVLNTVTANSEGVTYTGTMTYAVSLVDLAE